MCLYFVDVVEKFFGIDVENVFVEGVFILVMIFFVFGRVFDGVFLLKLQVLVYFIVFVVEDYIRGSIVCNQNGLISVLLKKRVSIDF